MGHVFPGFANNMRKLPNPRKLIILDGSARSELLRIGLMDEEWRTEVTDDITTSASRRPE
jgi:hypothetical protein